MPNLYPLPYYAKVGTQPMTINLKHHYRLRPGLSVWWRKDGTYVWEHGIVDNVEPLRITKM